MNITRGMGCVITKALVEFGRGGLRRLFVVEDRGRAVGVVWCSRKLIASLLSLPPRQSVSESREQQEHTSRCRDTLGELRYRQTGHQVIVRGTDKDEKRSMKRNDSHSIGYCPEYKVLQEELEVSTQELDVDRAFEQQYHQPDDAIVICFDVVVNRLCFE